MDGLGQLVTRVLNRRAALRLMGAAAAAAAAVGASCGGSKSSTTTTTTTSDSTCSIIPEGEEGPYFVDDSATGFNRSDIRSNLDGSNTQAGIPLILSIYVDDTENNCAAMSGVQVDIW